LYSSAQKELVNKSTSTHTLSTIDYMVTNTIYEDINMDALRGRSTISSFNSSSISSTYFMALSVTYYARMEQQSNDPI